MPSDLESHLLLLHIQQVSFKCCIFDNGEHVCCVNMDLHFILQVFRVIELKLGPQLKDLINALSGRLLISFYTPSHQFGHMFKMTKQIQLVFRLLVSNLVL